MNLNVQNSPFSQEQAENINRLLATLTKQQKIWLSGFLAYPLVAENGKAPEPGTKAPGKTAERKVTVLFGSETGNCQSLAEELVQKLKENQFNASSSALDDFKTNDLKKVQDLLIVTSTHGEGDPPDNAITFYEFLHSRRAPKLEGVRFSVLALGDQSYEFFCKTGRDIDKRLEELGGSRIYPREDCDVDFEEAAAGWIAGVIGVLKESRELHVQEAAVTVTDSPAPALKAVYSKTNPFQAEVLENINLNWHGSNKETRHLELSLEGSAFAFEPGDSLGIFPENDPQLVDLLIGKLGWSGEEAVPVNKQGDLHPLREALISHYEITRLTKPLLKQAAELFGNQELEKLVEPENGESLKAYLDSRDLLDLVQDYPPREVQPDQFVKILRKIPARLYSIASSYQANPDEVQLTIGTERFQAHGRVRSGVCSGQIANRIQPGDRLSVYIHRNPNFKLPENPETPVIMIGPGTGVAPFRAFLEEREARGIAGNTWLFFGDQHFSTDFLYQLDWQKWLKSGILARMDVAFSRDTAEKIYVQHRMMEHSKELYRWLENGANLYVCGDEKCMARDVQETLINIIAKEGGMDQEKAEDYLKQMRQQKRYQRDVY
ncbi:assimilatory sulfite reductase (NADPH) flavoprotein subunit [Heyndrickxia acidiproducens]|uniref:assimilatory sulfite reductase (NADPH) flavoprotein subunit n=1 Tax=Heyndrickxia acidiproducens TaxID=1121084 RepID=UPI00035FF926|nr:assimilatory sulfite reductase (NADPH) flavoprotein subunit [Heyndrickxia acidiproducens]